LVCVVLAHGSHSLKSESLRKTRGDSFAQFSVVQSQQLLPKPRQLGWVAASAYLLKLATAYRMLHGHPPHMLRPGASVLVGGGTGFLCSFDARDVWMHQKRIQGSHFAHMQQAMRANDLVAAGVIDPCLSRSFDWEELPHAHGLLARNLHPPGTMAIRVGCPNGVAT
ncbi:hypothetical protein MCW81_23125, partial [Cupriavidus gilardii]|nr:hypothetical protein [Cupriavidus gilardii]